MGDEVAHGGSVCLLTWRLGAWGRAVGDVTEPTVMTSGQRVVAREQGLKGGGEMSSGQEEREDRPVGRQLPARTFFLTPGLYWERPSPLSVSCLLNPDMMVSRADPHMPLRDGEPSARQRKPEATDRSHWCVWLGPRFS